MFTQKNELIDEIETIVGPSVNLKGNLKSDGDIRVKGKLSGEIKTKGNVFVDEGAEIKASIEAVNVKISGDITGDINTAEEVEICETGKVTGNISSRTLIIKMGAVFIGKSMMNTNETAKEKDKEDEAEDILMEPEPEIEE